ncbi:GNAT family N-acetyltransferase [Tessaracoccus caeni]|uniref:GNAT family N-acetyltransferase n=1 Tax=Tessaracoccus caeni TaxID=3031239 RepID=UPI0023DAFCCD|nr:GNAT family N-acetyltransferase [Tessaracoccus caeni]MDF1490093.1 GNAT family N-acetyltransferase [Tessaracoccus caeni]
MDSATHLLALHVGALYRLDEHGRLIETNEATPNPAPRVFVGRTAEGSSCYLRRDVPEGLGRRIDQLTRDLPLYPDRRGDAEVYGAIEDAIAEAGTIASRWHGLAYAFTTPCSPMSSEATEITDGRDVLVGPFAPFQTDLKAIWPFFGVLRDGRVVSACYSARLTDHAAEAGVDTDPAHRGQGLAATVINAWRKAIEDSGRTALYSTSYDNLSSQAVARRLGLSQYAETFSLT